MERILLSCRTKRGGGGEIEERVDGDEAVVAAADEEVGVEGGGREVVDAASGVGDITKDEDDVNGGK
ncbi:hypothetical protein MRB53_005366 [Persea americana]|uniref:Uncharacterized protein n=1 Tax=Persea americana TaxID=3435 RepID=A0ACC2MDY4_PERAE|nr:hypothetical protein MRB53_005366 [Persea americana]